jgi:predicted ATPase/DNA-binding CsgD family transcriptional regulator
VARASPVLFGRDSDLQALSALLDAHRLVAIVGTAGVGKTALASRLRETGCAADRRVHQVELAPLTDSDQVVPALVRALELAVSRTSAIEVVQEALRSGPHLLVLDNCEHLLPGVAALIHDLLEAAPDLVVLATSQEALSLHEERVYRLDALALPGPDASLEEARACGAIALFEHRAAAADHHFELTPENIAAVIDVCRHLDGIPLAIELAAARLRTLGVVGLRERLDDRLQLLASGARDQPARHRTLRAALEWSWSLLHANEQVVFRRLAVMAGSFDLDAVHAVAAGAQRDAIAVIDPLGVLCDKSLLAVEPLADGTVRYRLLESMRQFALEHLRAAGEEAAVRELHLAHFLGLSEAASEALAGPEQGIWLKRLDRDRDNLFAAHLACDYLPDGIERGLRLANALIRYWFNREALLLGQRIMAEALSRPGNADPTPRRALAHVNHGRMLSFRGLDLEAAGQFRLAIEAGRRCGAEHVVVEAMGRLGYAQMALNDRPGARATLEEACDIARSLKGDGRPGAIANSNLAELERLEGHFGAAHARYEASLAIHISKGDRQATMICLNNLAMAALALKALPEVRERMRASLAICDELDSRRGRLVVMEVCAGLASELEDWAHAVRFDAAARRLTTAMGRRRDVVDEVFLAPRVARARKALGRKLAQAAEQEGGALDYDAAIEAMHDWLDSRQDLTSPSRADPILTPREQEILSLIAKGYPNGDVARLLDISVLTVRTHRQRLMDKLQLHNAAEITAYAVKMGWYEPG